MWSLEVLDASFFLKQSDILFLFPQNLDQLAPAFKTTKSLHFNVMSAINRLARES